MTLPEECRLDPAAVAALYVQHADELRAFLWGVLREPHLVADVLQATFVKAIERGHTAREETLKGWLFQVAFREALSLRRRRSLDDRARQRLAEESDVTRGLPDDRDGDGSESGGPEQIALRRETIDRVRDAIQTLSQPQREVVRMRIYEQLKFTDIAAQTGTPLGTVLARMQAALKKLRDRLEP